MTPARPAPLLPTAENIARRMAAVSNGLDATEWLLAAILINQFARSEPCQKDETPHNRAKKSIVRGEER